MSDKTDTYDSTADTLAHIDRVQDLMTFVIGELSERALAHDLSKLQSPEKEVFDAETPNLKGLTYGSDEYKASLARMQKALVHHYGVNSHHPEHYEHGIRGMSLLDLVEMLCDWKAATERHENGDIAKSIEINQDRFGYSDDLKPIFHNTIKEMGWG